MFVPTWVLFAVLLVLGAGPVLAWMGLIAVYVVVRYLVPPTAAILAFTAAFYFFRAEVGLAIGTAAGLFVWFYLADFFAGWGNSNKTASPAE